MRGLIFQRLQLLDALHQHSGLLQEGLALQLQPLLLHRIGSGGGHLLGLRGLAPQAVDLVGFGGDAALQALIAAGKALQRLVQVVLGLLHVVEIVAQNADGIGFHHPGSEEAHDVLEEIRDRRAEGRIEDQPQNRDHHRGQKGGVNRVLSTA